ncbi:hypothetical protein D3C80_1459090 [compost metagenome]
MGGHTTTDAPVGEITRQGIHGPQLEQVLGSDGAVERLFRIVVHLVIGVAGQYFPARCDLTGGFQIDAFAGDFVLCQEAARTAVARRRVGIRGVFRCLVLTLGIEQRGADVQPAIEQLALDARFVGLAGHGLNGGLVG